MPNYVPRMMLGRLTDGAQADHGSRVHACLEGTCAAYCHGKALCGAAPGRRSVGWSAPETGRAVDCPRCVAKLKKIEKEIDSDQKIGDIAP